MDGSDVNKKAWPIEIKARSRREFFLLHGYTGSPTDFNQLGKYLNKRFNANVRIIRLKGHGEKIENIDNLDYHDFLLRAEEELIKDLKKGREIIIGGISLGSFLALHLSSKHSIKGILNVSIPYKPKFPIGIISFFEPLILKKHWKKPIAKYEKRKIKKAFFYDVNIRGFRILKKAKIELSNLLDKISAPCLIIHVAKDNVFSVKSARIVHEKLSSKIKEIFIYKTKKKSSHNPFYSLDSRILYRRIGDFVEKNKLFKQKKSVIDN